jgi:hypothetical protein
LREALAGREPRPAVDDDRPVAEHAGEIDHRHRDVAGADDEQQRGRREHLDECARAFGEERSRGTERHRVARFFDESLVERRVAESPGGRAVVQQQDLRADRTVEPRDDRGPSALLGMSAHALQEVGRQRLDEHLDRAAARQPDLPGLLVAQIQLEEPGPVRVQHVLGLLDHLGVHAAADGDGTKHGSAFTDEHLGAFFARRGAARVHQGRDRDLARRPPKFVNLIEEFRHRVLMIRRARPRRTPDAGRRRV